MTGPLASYAFAIRNLLGARIKVVPGYKGSASVKLAIQRGEVEGVCGVSLSTIKSQWRDDLQSGAFKLILQLSGQPQPEFKGAPHVDDFPKSDEERQLFELIFGAQALGPHLSSRRPTCRPRDGRRCGGLHRNHEGPAVPRRCRQDQDRHRAHDRRAGRAVHPSRVVGLASDRGARQAGDAGGLNVCSAGTDNSCQNTTTLLMLLPWCIRSNPLLMSASGMVWVIIGSI